MSPDILDALQAIAAATDTLDAREPCTPMERIERWHQAHVALENLSIVVGQMEHEAVNAMVELGREELATTLGPVHTEPGYAREEWDGAGVLDALATDMALTASGEVTRGVPLEVLRDVIPAVSEGSTSSKWKATGLKKHGIMVSRYRTKHDAPLRLRTGPAFRR